MIFGCLVVVVEGFCYFFVMKDLGFVWDDEMFWVFLVDFKGIVFCIKMVFPGLCKDDDLDNIIVYLKGF